MVKKKGISKILASVLALSLMLSLSSFTVSADGDIEENVSLDSRSGEKTYLAVLGISNTRVSSYPSLSITRNGSTTGLKALLINGLYYVPARAFFESLNMKATYTASSRTLNVSGNGFSLTAADGSYAIFANDRVLFENTPARLMSDGRLYIPAKTAAKSLGLRLTESSALNFSGTVSPIRSGADFYRSDEVYWLSRIISAESRGEPLIGQIAVGNVILNRVRSKSFPNTIWGVIFDKKYGVQFSPTADGTIYNAPVYTATLAAKICLEGYSVSDSILYFLAPRYAQSSWIQKNRPYAFTVKNHEFYN